MKKEIKITELKLFLYRRAIVDFGLFVTGLSVKQAYSSLFKSLRRFPIRPMYFILVYMSFLFRFIRQTGIFVALFNTLEAKLFYVGSSVK